MAIGMTYEQYWYDDPLMVRAFREADKIRQERANENAWLNGGYVALAISSTIGNAFRENSSQRIDYPERPIDIRKESEEEDEELEILRARVYMNNMVWAGRNWGKQQDGI